MSAPIHAVSPWAGLLGTEAWRLPKSGAVSIVVEGQRVTNARQIRALMLAQAEPDDPDDIQSALARAALLIKQLHAAKDAARYQRRKQDPEFLAKRKAYAERTRAERAEWKRQYDAKNKALQRAQKTAWARRKRAQDPAASNAASKAWYEANREQVLAKKKAQRQAANADQLVQGKRQSREQDKEQRCA